MEITQQRASGQMNTLAVNQDGSINVVSQAEALIADKEIIDANADGNTYFGYAAPGTATSAASWRIQRMLVSGNTKTFQYANGSLAFNNVWDNRTGLTYS